MRRIRDLFYKTLFFSLLCYNCILLSAQVSGFGISRINQDGSVTFRYVDSTAKKVKLLCDCDLRQQKTIVKSEGAHKIKMLKDSAGVWSYTTPPLTPEVYTYQFITDNGWLLDPANSDSVRVYSQKRSFFVLRGTPQADLYVRDVMQGKLDTLVLHRKSEGKSRRILVYTPPQYAEGSDSYPVLYLLHGLNGNETAWMDRGQAAQILENLILQQKAKPMILVMPDANPECFVGQDETVSLMKNILLFSKWSKQEFERCYPEMEAFLKEKYRFADWQGSRAVAGLSAGAKQSANLANMCDSTFSAVGLFSPVIGKQQLPVSHYSEYWISGGSGDILHPQMTAFCRKLKREGVKYSARTTIGGHTWRNWRVYFSEFVQTLF